MFCPDFIFVKKVSIRKYCYFFAIYGIMLYTKIYVWGYNKMEKKHIKTLSKATLKESAAKGGCGECQTSCQSACKTSCTVANQECER